MQPVLRPISKHLSRLATAALVVTFIVASAFVGDASAFQRKVMLEDFTSTTCPPCARAAPALEAALEEVGDQVVAATAFHMNWPNPGNDPWFHDNPTDNGGSGVNGGRRSVYGINGIPTFVIDGSTYGGSRTRQAFAAAIMQRYNVASPLEINLSADIQNGTLTVDVEVTAEDDLNRVYLYVSLNEDYVQYHAPTGQNDHHDAMVKMIPDWTGTSFGIEDGETRSFHLEQSMAGLGWHELVTENLILVAWVQAENNTIHQAQNFFFVPGVELGGWDVVDEDLGDGDGRPEAGERAGIVVTIDNAPAHAVARSINVSVTCSDDAIEFENNSFQIDELVGGESFSNTENPIVFSVPEDAVAHPVTFTLTITSDEDEDLRIEQEFDLMIDWPPFLVVNASGDENADEEMMHSFGVDGYPYADSYDREVEGLVTSDVVENYQIVLWHSFNARAEIVNDWEADVLIAYLNNGGTLIMSSPGYVREASDTPLMRDYFLAELDNPDTGENKIEGIEGDPHFDGMYIYAGGREGAGYPSFAPSLNALEGGQVVMEWKNRNNVFGNAGIANVNDTYQTLLLSFPIESIAGFLGSDSRDDFMARMWDWYQNPVGVSQDEQEVPTEFAVESAYPNPFNSSATVRFSLDITSVVQFALYDINGRLMHTVMTSELTPGRHAVSLNADRIGLSSGVYYLKVTAGDRSTGQKIVFMR